MAKIIKEYTDDQGRALIEYDSGLIKDAVSGHIVKPPPHVLINENTAIAYHRKRAELRRETVRAVASASVDGAKFGIYGDMAYIAAITEAITKKALNEKDPKQVDAARFLLLQAGDSEDSMADNNQDQAGAVRGVVRDIADIARAAIQLHAQKNGVNGGA